MGNMKRIIFLILLTNTTIFCCENRKFKQLIAVINLKLAKAEKAFYKTRNEYVYTRNKWSTMYSLYCRKDSQGNYLIQKSDFILIENQLKELEEELKESAKKVNKIKEKLRNLYKKYVYKKLRVKIPESANNLNILET